MSIEDATALDAFGVWHVTTEGDCEGRSTADLGVHEGYLDQVAFDLAPQAMYTLTFNPPDPVSIRTKIPSLHDHVVVNLGYKFGLDKMTEQARVGFFERMLRDRPVRVEPASFYASATLRRTITPQMKAEIETLALRFKREAALAKLSREERTLLGLK
jgi:hypothetical protein